MDYGWKGDKKTYYFELHQTRIKGVCAVEKDLEEEKKRKKRKEKK